MNRAGQWRFLAILCVGLLSGCQEAEVKIPSGEGSGAKSGGGKASGSGSGVADGRSEVGGPESPSKLPRTKGRTRDPRPAPNTEPTAVAIPGKPGFVFNPFTNNVVDVREIPPGTIVRDPQDEGNSRLFRVPKIPKEEEGSAENGEAEDLSGGQ